MESYYSTVYLSSNPLKTKLLFQARKVIASSCPHKSLMGEVGDVFLMSFCFILVYTCGLQNLQEG